MWNSVETLETVNDWLNGALWTFGVLAVVTTVLVYFVGKRISSLQIAATQALQVRVDAAEDALKESESRRVEEERAQEDQKQQEEQRRWTPPALDVYLAFSEPSQQLVFVIDAKNDIPIEYTRVVVTEKNVIVSNIQTQVAEFYPEASPKKRLIEKMDLERVKVRNNYIELRVRYASRFAAELGNPKDLFGEITRRYRLEGERVFDWTDEPKEDRPKS